jgi:hypothetical protein
MDLATERLGLAFEKTRALVSGVPAPAGQLAVGVAAALVSAAVVFHFVERDGRQRWREVPADPSRPPSPYRSARASAGYLGRAPFRIRALALSCFFYGHLFVPGLLVAVFSFRFDGLTLLLGPGVFFAGALWWCGYLLVRREDRASELSLSIARAALFSSGGLLVIALLHLGVLEPAWSRSGWAPGAPLACVALAYAIASGTQAWLLLGGVRLHRAQYADRASVER